MAKSICKYFLTLSAAFFSANLALGQECTVTIKNGTIFGEKIDTANSDKKVCAYTAIPYAAPPVGSLRFKAPQPSKSWETLNATSQPSWCPQDEGLDIPSGITMSEDCLYLNIYQPYGSSENSNSEPLPVMIWFHGGGFTGGSSMLYTPEKLLARDNVILVVAQYRLGLLGFLSTGNSDATGNFGLKDQSQVIKWVHENIHNFSGNNSQVVVFGESAGGASSIFQLITPLNKGLIHGVIAQSGTALASWSLDKNPIESARFMANRLGCENISSSAEIVACLREMKWEKIIEEQKKYTYECHQNLVYASATMLPVVEPDLPGAFISDDPVKIMQSGDIPDIPVMLGATKHDGSFILANLYLAKFGPEKLHMNPEYMKTQIVPDMLKFFNVEEDVGNSGSAASVELAYLSGVNRSSWNESMPGLVDLLSVFAFKSSIEKTADLLSRRNLKVYLYSFEHHSENSFWPLAYGQSKPPVSGGIAHADDLIYLFNFPTQFSRADQSFSDLFCDLWTNFGKSGNPTPNNGKNFVWPLYTPVDEAFVKLNATPTVQYGYRDSWRPNGFQWE